MAASNLKIREVLELNERVVEYPFAFSYLSVLRGRSVLDVGVGACPGLWYCLNSMGYNVVGTDLGKGVPYVDGRTSKIVKDDITKSSLKSNSFDGIFCISALEHILEFNLAVSEMVRIVRSGGIVVITTPYNKNQYRRNVSKSKKRITQVYTQSIYDHWVSMFKGEVFWKYWKAWSGSFWRQGTRFSFPSEASRENADLCCCCCVKG